MSWSKVKNPMTKPIGWWYHKFLCEFGYWMFWRNRSCAMYYRHLNKLCTYGYDLYGRRLNRIKHPKDKDGK